MNIEEIGFLRIDLLGSTLDLPPIDLIVSDSVTLNAAISLNVRVRLIEQDTGGVEIISRDYNSKVFFPRQDFVLDRLRGGHFKELTFVAEILHYFGVVENVSLCLESDSSTGGGLGGSSVLGMTLYQALARLKGIPFEPLGAVRVIRDIESRILDSGPAGYQDYYPTLYGGILGLRAHPGEVEVCQLYTEKNKKFLQNHLTLVNSKISHHSGFNNWQLYKSFFDKEPTFRRRVEKIAELSHQAFEELRHEKLTHFLSLMSEEGRERAEFYPGMLVPEIQELCSNLHQEDDRIGVKVCGAGGGGCFLLIHPPEARSLIQQEVGKTDMDILPLEIENPLKASK